MINLVLHTWDQAKEKQMKNIKITLKQETQLIRK